MTFLKVSLCVILLAEVVLGHGHMITPSIRIPAGDDQNGLTITRGPTPGPCAGLKPGRVQSRFKKGQTVQIAYEIGAAHQGDCFLELSTTGADTKFQTLKKFKCAQETGNFKTTVKLPKNKSCKKCTLRFRWNAALTRELYHNCADISIKG